MYTSRIVCVWGGGRGGGIGSICCNLIISVIQEVSNISPLSYCRGERPEITLLGMELDANLNQHLANCRFSNQLLGLEFSTEKLISYTRCVIISCVFIFPFQIPSP